MSQDLPGDAEGPRTASLEQRVLGLWFSTLAACWDHLLMSIK